MNEIRILHLSDIHMGEIQKIGFKHSLCDNNKKSFLQEKVYKALQETDINSNNLENLFLVVSGDLVCNGSVSGDYRKAFAAIETLCNNDMLGINKKRVIIVPGNHDIDRHDPEHPLKNFIPAYNEFFGGINSLDQNFGKDNFEKSKYLHIDENYKVIFIPLYSVYAGARKYPEFVKKFYQDEKFEETENWIFDRGFITEIQLKHVTEELETLKKELEEKQDDLGRYIKIVIFHHNPMPVERYAVIVDEHNFPEICLLANGPEILSRLIKMGINIVLHGHTHQNSIHYHVDNNKESSLIVLGAPSVGCSYNSDKPWYPVPEMGFNHISIINSSAFPKIRLDRFIYNRSNREFKRNTEDGTFYLETNPLISKELNTYVNPRHFVCFDEGIRLLSELILRKSNQVFLLNYSEGVTWDDCFEEIWKEILKTEDVIKSIATKFRISAEEVKKLLQEAINQKTYTEPLISKFREPKVSESILGQMRNSLNSDDKFTVHIDTKIKNEQYSNARDTNYFVEIFRCVIDKNFTLKKGIYLGRSDEGKYEWLCDSILAARNLENFNIAWLPFEIRDYDGKSLVAGLNDRAGVTVLVGYAEPHDENKYEKTVFYLPDDVSLHTDTGFLCTNLNALMRKIIVPLSERILNDFPLYKDGKLYFNNLNFLANEYKYDDVWKKYEKQFENNFKRKIVKGQTITKKKIKTLYKWVVNVSKGIAVPWNEKDYKYLAGKKRNNVRNS